jgi:hypothetical protein
MKKSRPRAQNPATWDGQFTAFLDAFSAHFRVDLNMAR